MNVLKRHYKKFIGKITVPIFIETHNMAIRIQNLIQLPQLNVLLSHKIFFLHYFFKNLHDNLKKSSCFLHKEFTNSVINL